MVESQARVETRPAGHDRDVRFEWMESSTYKDSGAFEGLNMYSLLRRSVNSVSCLSSLCNKTQSARFSLN